MKRNNWFSAIALFLSILACIVTWLRVEIYTTNDTFVGIMAGFMGACATLVVGVQIYNSIDTMQEIKNLKQAYEGKISKIEQMQSQLQAELESAEEDRRKSKILYNANQMHSYGMALFSKQPFTSFEAFFNSLRYALEYGDSKLIKDYLYNLNAINDSIAELIEKNDKISKSSIDEVDSLDFKSFEVYPLYPLIKNECEQIKKKASESIARLQKKH